MVEASVAFDDPKRGVPGHTQYFYIIEVSKNADIWRHNVKMQFALQSYMAFITMLTH